MLMMKEHWVEPKLYYQVTISYEPCEATIEIPDDERMMQSAPIGDLERAEDIAKHTIQQIHTKFPQTNIIELELDNAADGYHLLIVDEDNNRVAKVGVAYTEYSNETMH